LGFGPTALPAAGTEAGKRVSTGEAPQEWQILCRFRRLSQVSFCDARRGVYQTEEPPTRQFLPREWARQVRFARRVQWMGATPSSDEMSRQTHKIDIANLICVATEDRALGALQARAMLCLDCAVQAFNQDKEEQ
jgi:hypothetical protein